MYFIKLNYNYSLSYNQKQEAPAVGVYITGALLSFCYNVSVEALKIIMLSAEL